MRLKANLKKAQAKTQTSKKTQTKQPNIQKNPNQDIPYEQQMDQL